MKKPIYFNGMEEDRRNLKKLRNHLDAWPSMEIFSNPRILGGTWKRGLGEFREEVWSLGLSNRYQLRNFCETPSISVQEFVSIALT